MMAATLPTDLLITHNVGEGGLLIPVLLQSGMCTTVTASESSDELVGYIFGVTTGVIH